MSAIRWRASFIVIAGQTFVLRRRVVAVVGRDDAMAAEGLVMICIEAAIWAGLQHVPHTRQRTGTSRKFDGLGVFNFNLASTFVNGDLNFVELFEVQSVEAIAPWRD
jgi:hypothetical protein